MRKNTLNFERLKSSGEKGVHSKFDWIKEAESKLASALMLREIAKAKQSELSSRMKNGNSNTSSIFELSQPLESARKNSFLLLGYAIELLLKSGIVSLLINVPKSALEDAVKGYGHKLPSLAKDLHMDLSCNEYDILNSLSSFIIIETRYPVTAPSIQDYYRIVNKISTQLADDEIFNLAVGIYKKIEEVIRAIDGTVENPKSYGNIDIDSDGFIMFRIGGSLPPVFVIKYSSEQVATNSNNLNVMKALLEIDESRYIIRQQMLKHWEQSDFYLVSDKCRLTKMS